MGWSREEWEEFCRPRGISPAEILKSREVWLDERRVERTQKAKETRERKERARKAKGPTAAGIPYTEREQDKDVALEAPVSRTQPELETARGGPRVKITIRGIRRRLLDPDNFVAGCKGLVDGLVASGIAHGDSAKAIEEGVVAFHYEQELTPSYWKEATEVEIELEDRPPES